MMTTPEAPIKFAYWVPNVSGGLVISNIEQRTGWDIDYNRKLAQIAEASGFDYALSQIRFTAGYGADNQHESVSFSHALAAATEKLTVIAALLPGPWNPALAAKQIATINHLTGGRIAVNVVSGWFRGEFAAIGEPWLDHDERYRRSEEFIRALRGIWTEDPFTFAGDFYRFRDYSMRPKPIDPQPEIFQGGSSRAARDMAARVSDWYFTNGNTPEGIRKQVEDIREKAAAEGRTVKVGVNAFAIARETEAEVEGSARRDHRQGQPGRGARLRPRGEECRQGLAGGRGQLGEVELRGPRPVQRRLPHQPDRHAGADRRADPRHEGCRRRPGAARASCTSRRRSSSSAGG